MAFVLAFAIVILAALRLFTGPLDDNVKAFLGAVPVLGYILDGKDFVEHLTDTFLIQSIADLARAPSRDFPSP